jgi:hypothetical protein
LHDEIGVLVHVTSQVATFPAAISLVHTLPSSQAVGQLPSHFSPLSTTPLPQTGLQSLSLVAFAPGGQQPSPLAAAVIAGCEQTTLHCTGFPVCMSAVQALSSSHDDAQVCVLLVGSHVSGAVTTPSPQLFEQSVSLP